MFNMHKEINAYHDNHVRLSRDEKNKLADYRDANLKRLGTGLDKLGEESGQTYAHYHNFCNQGSYVMHTINQHPDNDYDIDVGVIFWKDDLPSSPLAARQRIRDALQKSGEIFKQPPEALTNAVRVYYAEGYHVDFAVYREYEADSGAIVVEHAGSEWTPREPAEITRWFQKAVRDQSPQGGMGSAVEAGQMRRIVCWLKAFAKAQASESYRLPGGLIISVLAAECYQSDSTRDDASLYWTMQTIHQRLRLCLDVRNPIATTQKLTHKEKHIQQVKRFRDELGVALENLAVLLDTRCTHSQAMNAWRQVFRHPFWDEATQEASKTLSKATLAETAPLGQLRILARLANEKGEPTSGVYPSDGEYLDKNRWLRFSIVDRPFGYPYAIRWIVKNHGPEAEQADDLGPRLDGTEDTQWERTGYTGKHTMTCEAHRNGIVLARARYVVNVK